MQTPVPSGPLHIEYTASEIATPTMDGENAFGMVGTRGDEKIKFELYHYTPSLPAAVTAATIFAILTALHIWRMFRHRSFYFIAFTIGGARELPRAALGPLARFRNRCANPFGGQSKPLAMLVVYNRTLTIRRWAGSSPSPSSFSSPQPSSPPPSI